MPETQEAAKASLSLGGLVREANTLWWGLWLMGETSETATCTRLSVPTGDAFLGWLILTSYSIPLEGSLL